MRIPAVFRKQCFYKGLYALIVVALSLFLFTGVGFASSEGGPKGWINTDTYRVMNFAVLAIALFFIVRKPVSRALSRRIKGIEEQLSELESKKTEAEKEMEKFGSRLKLMEQEAEKIKEEYIKQGHEAKERILEEAKKAAVKLEEQAERNIEQEFSRAKDRVQAEIIEKALIKAEEIVAGGITGEDQDRLIDEYLEKVA